MIAALLFIIAGLLFSFTGVGIFIGVPLICLGFLIMGAKGIGWLVGIDSTVGKLAIAAGLLFLVYFFAGHAHAAEIAAPAPIPQMLRLNACYEREAGPAGGTVKAALLQHRNAVVYLTDRCSAKTVAFVEACAARGYPQENCMQAAVGAAQDIVAKIAGAEEMGP